MIVSIFSNIRNDMFLTMIELILDSTCSNTSCSICSTDTSHSEDEEIPIETKPPETAEHVVPSPSTNLQKSSSVDVLNHPPLPSFPRNVRQNAATITKSQTPANYVPPLPYFPRNNNLFKQKVFIPKPELKISAHKKMYYNREKSFSSTNINDIYSTVPTLKHSSSGFLSSTPKFPDTYSTLDNFDNLLSRTPYAPSHANTRYLGSNYDMPAQARITKPPKALPRTNIVLPFTGQPQQQQSQQHHVIDIVPLPKDKFTLDQTIGIPIINDHEKKSHQNQINYFKSGPPYSIKEEDKYKSTPQIIHQYPLIAGNIPPVPMFTNKGNYSQSDVDTSSNNLTLLPHTPMNPSKKKDITTNSILSNNVSNVPSSTSASTSTTTKKETGEKNKVKFSDTVVIAVSILIELSDRLFQLLIIFHSQEIPRKNKANNFTDRPRAYHSTLMDPKRELADSLPLCHPNEDYLKDFTPMQGEKMNIVTLEFVY